MPRSLHRELPPADLLHTEFGCRIDPSRRGPNNDYGNRDKNGPSRQSKGRRKICSREAARGNTLDAQTRKPETFAPGIAILALLEQHLISMKIAIIGSGYVGLVTGACFAEVGHEVICIDNDERKVKALRRGRIPIYEPGLDQLVQRNVSAHRLSFTGSIEEGVDNSQVIFIAVPTPPQVDGSVDLTYIERVAREIASVLKEYRVIVDKSTVPVKTGEKVAHTIRRYNKVNVEFDVVSNPEFLREGCAVADLMEPDRIVIGSNSERALAIMKKVYEPFMAPIMVTDINSAELIKHAANSFLALKISYINAVSGICEASGADIEKVADGIGADKRIGRSFLNAGLGYGGGLVFQKTSLPSSRSANRSASHSPC